nr:Arm DNA-binding domain-containing protein [Selenomonas bovis]
MPVFKDEARGTWYVMVRYQDWTGERKQKCKRGFATKREAQEWERSFQMQTSGDLDMTFEAFTELYTKDKTPAQGEHLADQGEHHPEENSALLWQAED